LAGLIGSGLSFTKLNQWPWKLLRLGFSESADVATRSEMGKRIAVTDAGRGTRSHTLKSKLRRLIDWAVGGRLQSSGGSPRVNGTLSK
jgi:hypothetical protein